jgi:hypothetical protein
MWFEFRTLLNSALCSGNSLRPVFCVYPVEISPTGISDIPTEIFPVFLSLAKRVPGYCLQTGYGHFFPNILLTHHLQSSFDKTVLSTLKSKYTGKTLLLSSPKIRSCLDFDSRTIKWKPNTQYKDVSAWLRRSLGSCQYAVWVSSWNCWYSACLGVHAPGWATNVYWAGPYLSVCLSTGRIFPRR